jgi:hypothetical protein
MAVTKAQILTALNLRLNRSETDIDTFIVEALANLCGRGLWKDLWTTDNSTGTLADGSASFNLPTDLMAIDRIVLHDGTDYGDPLKLASWDDMLTWRKGTQTGAEPGYYCPRGRTAQVHPAADAAYTPYVYYWKWAVSADSIPFRDLFRPVLTYATQAFFCAGVGLAADPKFTEQWGLYENALAKLVGEKDTQVHQVMYHDV